MERRRDLEIEILRTGEGMDLQVEKMKIQVRRISLPYML